jgi:uncharacterized membrane protein
MDVFFIILRLIHVGGAIFWGGAALFMFLFLEPALHMAGSAAGAVQQSLVRNTKFPVAIALSSILTTLSGIIMYWRDSNGLDLNWIKTGTGLTFTIGGIAGIAATIIGGSMLSPLTAKAGKLQAEIASSGGNASPSQAAELAAIQTRLAMVNRIDFIVIAIAILTMASARYI